MRSMIDPFLYWLIITATHSHASLSSLPPHEDAYFMVGKYTPVNPYYRYFPTAGGNGFRHPNIC